AEEREIRQSTGTEAEKTRNRDEQQPRRERNRRRNDEKRQAQQEVKVLNREEQPEQETEQEERVQVMPRRKQRQLTKSVRIQSQADEAAAVDTVEAPVAPAQSTELAKVDLPAVVENVQEQDDNGEARDNAGMPRRSRRSPRHLRVSGQRRRRYRDERYPLQSPMPLAIACASPEMASGKAWIRYPVARPLEQEAQIDEQTNAVEPVVTDATTVAPEEVNTAAAIAVESQVAPVETTHPEVIAAPVAEQPQIIANE
ncbi:ribonuclease E, partial [Escherichia coli]|nr:ribonuclease E [Escherichia coli]